MASNKKRHLVTVRITTSNIEMNVKLEGLNYQIRLYSADFCELSPKDLIEDETKRLMSIVTGHGRYGRTKNVTAYTDDDHLVMLAEISTHNVEIIAERLNNMLASPRKMMSFSYLGKVIPMHAELFDYEARGRKVESVKYISNSGRFCVDVTVKEDNSQLKETSDGR